MSVTFKDYRMCHDGLIRCKAASGLHASVSYVDRDEKLDHRSSDGMSLPGVLNLQVALEASMSSFRVSPSPAPILTIVSHR